ncbi:hypothetical protein HMPREF1051_0233 [Neisseria sicca VK64]|uniref:Uncharacterized protein n=1 Tax=Neisseria sicca VK64 TaxID=1095748 RepID=I2NWP6_NEISI|nr:hypothetical protein HMPREF1051_0233 [Neisseria sicca VK64]
MHMCNSFKICLETDKTKGRLKPCFGFQTTSKKLKSLL